MIRRTVFVLASATALLLLGWSAHAQGIVGWSVCKLYPSRCAPPVQAPLPPLRPAPPPAPKAAAPAPAPKVDAGRPMPSGPVVAKPKAKPKAAVRVKAKPKAVKRKRVIRPRVAAPRRRVVDEPGLPAGMCPLIAAAGRFGKTMNDVEAAARARGQRMNARQRDEASRCLNS